MKLFNSNTATKTYQTYRNNNKFVVPIVILLRNSKSCICRRGILATSLANNKYYAILSTLIFALALGLQSSSGFRVNSTSNLATSSSTAVSRSVLMATSEFVSQPQTTNPPQNNSLEILALPVTSLTTTTTVRPSATTPTTVSKTKIETQQNNSSASVLPNRKHNEKSFVAATATATATSDAYMNINSNVNKNADTTTLSTILPEPTDRNQDDNSNNDNDPDTDPDTGNNDDANSYVTQEANDNNKLQNVIISSVNEAADQILSKIQPKSQDDANDTDNDNDNDNVNDDQLSENDTTTTGSGDTTTIATDTELTTTTELSNNKKADKRREAANDKTQSKKPISSSLGLANKRLSKKDLQDEQQKAKLAEAFRAYDKWRATGDELIELLSRKLLPVVMQHSYEVDGETISGIAQIFSAIRQLKPWALKLLDSSAHLASGLLVGSQTDFGDFDECLSVRVDDPSATGLGEPIELDSESFYQQTNTMPLTTTTIYGKYCLADVEFPKPPRRPLTQHSTSSFDWSTSSQLSQYEPIELRNPLLNFSHVPKYNETIFAETANYFHMLYVDPVRLGVCVTNKINHKSLELVLNKLLSEFKVSVSFKDRCVTKYDKVIWTSYQLMSACVLFVVGFLVVLSTFIELIIELQLANKKPATSGNILFIFGVTLNFLRQHSTLLTSFSILRNTKRLFKLKKAHQHHASTNSNSCLDNICTSSSLYSTSSLLTATKSTSMLSNDNIASSESLLLSSTMLASAAAARARLGNNKPITSALEGHKTFKSSSSSLEQNSVISNNYQTNNIKQTNLDCLHGVRVLTMAWMVVNHTYMFGGFFVLWTHRRLIDIAEWPKSLVFQFVLNGWLTVETFFFLSSTMIVLNVMPLMRRNKFSYLSYVAHRLVRLLPAYFGLICLNFLWPLASSGPTWLVKGNTYIQKPCENYLWTNFLFINNWIWPEKMCMVHTWFLSADFQLYLLTPIVVFILSRKPSLGHMINICIALLGSFVSGYVIYANKLMPMTLINKLEFDAIKQQLSYSYFATYQHIGPYCLGVVVGYVLYLKPAQVKLPKHVTYLLWIVLPPLSFATFLLTYFWNGAYDDPQLINPSPLISGLYVAIHRLIWTSLVAWLVFSCATGRAKLLASFLGHQMFVPFSRLSFGIYLVHFPIIMYRAMNIRHTLEWTDANFLWAAAGNFVASIFGAYLLYIAFECPVINLEALIWNKQSITSATSRTMSHKQAPADSPTSLGTRRSSNGAITSTTDLESPPSSVELATKRYTSPAVAAAAAKTKQQRIAAANLLAEHRRHYKQQQLPNKLSLPEEDEQDITKWLPPMQSLPINRRLISNRYATLAHTNSSQLNMRQNSDEPQQAVPSVSLTYNNHYQHKRPIKYNTIDGWQHRTTKHNNNLTPSHSNKRQIIISQHDIGPNNDTQQANGSLSWLQVADHSAASIYGNLIPRVDASTLKTSRQLVSLSQPNHNRLPLIRPHYGTIQVSKANAYNDEMTELEHTRNEQQLSGDNNPSMQIEEVNEVLAKHRNDDQSL